MDKREQDRPDPALEALEAELRGVPAPQPPADLEARLIAAVRRGVACAGPRRRWAIRLAVAAAAAAAAVIVGVALSPRDSEPMQSRHALLLNDTSPSRIVYYRHSSKETDPCDILPPLPFLQQPPA